MDPFARRRGAYRGGRKLVRIWNTLQGLDPLCHLARSEHERLASTAVAMRQTYTKKRGGRGKEWGYLRGKNKTWLDITSHHTATQHTVPQHNALSLSTSVSSGRTCTRAPHTSGNTMLHNESMDPNPNPCSTISTYIPLTLVAWGIRLRAIPDRNIPKEASSILELFIQWISIRRADPSVPTK